MKKQLRSVTVEPANIELPDNDADRYLEIVSQRLQRHLDGNSKYFTSADVRVRVSLVDMQPGSMTQKVFVQFSLVGKVNGQSSSLSVLKQEELESYESRKDRSGIGISKTQFLDKVLERLTLDCVLQLHEKLDQQVDRPASSITAALWKVGTGAAIAALIQIAIWPFLVKAFDPYEGEAISLGLFWGACAALPVFGSIVMSVMMLLPKRFYENEVAGQKLLTIIGVKTTGSGRRVLCIGVLLCIALVAGIVFAL